MKKPFFSKFLENQVQEEAVKGGATTKHPSDNDEFVFPFPVGLPGGGAQTNKWPSDGDDDLPPGFGL